MGVAADAELYCLWNLCQGHHVTCLWALDYDEKKKELFPTGIYLVNTKQFSLPGMERKVLAELQKQ